MLTGRLVEGLAHPVGKILSGFFRGLLPSGAFGMGASKGILVCKWGAPLWGPPRPFPLPAARHHVSINHHSQYICTILILQCDFS